MREISDGPWKQRLTPLVLYLWEISRLFSGIKDSGK
jgi:hypothetical protein